MVHEVAQYESLIHEVAQYESLIHEVAQYESMIHEVAQYESMMHEVCHGVHEIVGYLCLDNRLKESCLFARACAYVLVPACTDAVCSYSLSPGVVDGCLSQRPHGCVCPRTLLETIVRSNHERFEELEFTVRRYVTYML